MWSKCFLYIRRCLSVDLNTVEFFPYQSTQRNILLGSLTRIKDIGFKQTNIFCGTLTFTRVLCITSVDNYHMSLRRLQGVIKNTVLFTSVVTDTQLFITSYKAVPLEYPPVSKYMTRLMFQGNTFKTKNTRQNRE